MSIQNWFKFWDEHFVEFEWFFLEYGFKNEWEALLRARDKEHQGTMLTLMNRVWFLLPSNKFNIRNNPKGWDSFLYLLENE